MRNTQWNDIKRIDDEAQGVAKFVYTKADAVAESVLYRYPDYKTRTVICCSTQSGCPIGCRFCGAGDNFVRSLTADEIVSQVEYSLKQVDCDPNEMGRLQIMFMSMGEPLLNLKELIPAMRVLYAKYPKAALLISTSAPDIGRDGYDRLYAVCEEIDTIGLQFSVHETTDAARDLLIPFKKKLTLDQIAEEGLRFNRATNRPPFFNYCAHDGNVSTVDADRLASLFGAVFCATVSVVCERTDGMAATNDHQRKLAVDFGQLLVERCFDVRVFDPAGQDTIGGGCGQLHFVQRWFGDHPDMARPSIGAGLPEIHAPATVSVPA